MKSLKSKDLIRDDGRIRGCDSNIAKMTVLEVIYCRIFVWKTIPDMIIYDNKEFFIEFLKGLRSLLYLIINIGCIPFYPIILPIVYSKSIKRAKAEVEKYRKANDEMHRRFKE